jgi:hypothetical protein
MFRLSHCKSFATLILCAIGGKRLSRLGYRWGGWARPDRPSGLMISPPVPTKRQTQWVPAEGRAARISYESIFNKECVCSLVRDAENVERAKISLDDQQSEMYGIGKTVRQSLRDSSGGQVVSRRVLQWLAKRKSLLTRSSKRMPSAGGTAGGGGRPGPAILQNKANIC